ncbi:MAG TPA: DUF3347 domain-containing protein [Chitinophagaceae bacterium]|nr:DUF3347 domain-containing protein [Chitinophagaceae bacterium]
MRKLLALLLLVALAFGTWWFFFKDKSHDSGPKQQPLNVGKHSSEFTQSISSVVTAYLSLKEAFVNADMVKIKEEEKHLVATLDSIRLDELKKDTTGIFQSAQLLIGDIRSNAEAIFQETDITEMRQDFRMVSENLFPLLKTIRYEGTKLYWQNCPMAFGEGKDASWISSTEEIINPYLGKNHPEFKSTMLHCGEIKDTIQ